MTVGLLKEPQTETRVSLLPEGVAQLTKKGISVFVESGAGLRSSASDEDYRKAGATVVSAEEVVRSAEVIMFPGSQQGFNVFDHPGQFGLFQPCGIDNICSDHRTLHRRALKQN